MVMSLVWQVFEPLLFGLVGAEVSVEYMNTKVVGKLQWDIRADFKQPVSRSHSLLLKLCCGSLKKTMLWELNLQIVIVNSVKDKVMG